MKSCPMPAGSPAIVVVCAGANRACELLKHISVLRVRAGKLFSRHLKIEDQQRLLSNQAYSVVVGTPARMLKLAKQGHLKMSHCRLLVLDMHRGGKGMNVMELPDVAADAAELYALYVHEKATKLAVESGEGAGDEAGGEDGEDEDDAPQKWRHGRRPKLPPSTTCKVLLW